MKSKEEIEKYLGMKIESNKEEQTRDSSYAMAADTSRYVSKYQNTYTVIVKVLPEESVNALKSLLKDSIKQGDLETAATCHSILLEESTFYKGHPNAIGLDINESMALNKYEAEQKAKAEEQARLKAEQDAKEKAEEQAILKAKQDAKERAEEQTRLKAEQEEKERQASTEKDIAEFEQYEELVSRKPELEQLFQDMFYEDFSAASNSRISERMVELLEDLKKLPDNERKIILQRYNGLAAMKINENGQLIKDGVVQELPERNDDEQENLKEEQVEVEIRDDGLEEQFDVITSGLDWNRVNSQQAKEYEQQQPERIRPLEESIRDTTGDKKDKQNQMQMKETKNLTVDIWMNRFNSWYSAIDRVSQNVKAKFIKMKLDIVNAISTKIKERMNKRKINTQEQDSGER